MVPELVLALSDPLLGALANGLHDVWVTLAQMSLLVHQARDVVADHTGPQCTDVPDPGRQKRVMKNELDHGETQTRSEVVKGSEKSSNPALVRLHYT